MVTNASYNYYKEAVPRCARIAIEDLYAAYGQTDAGRYLIIFFVRKNQTSALPISARDMTESERRYYERQT